VALLLRAQEERLRKGYLSPLKYVQSGFKVEGERVAVSLGASRKDGVRQVSFRISHRPDVPYERVREVSIAYDKETGRLEARLVVEVRPRENKGTGRVAVDLGETVLMAAAFEDGTALLYPGRLVKSVRRSWPKVRASLKQNSRRWKETAHRERKQVEHLLHVTTSHFIGGEIAIGDLTGTSAPMVTGVARTLKGSSGCVARTAVVSYCLGWHGGKVRCRVTAEPVSRVAATFKRRDKALRASI